MAGSFRYPLSCGRVCLVLLLAGVCSAGHPKQSVRFYPYGTGSLEGLMAASGSAEPVALSLHEGRRSVVYEHRAGEPLMIFRDDVTEAAAGERRMVGRVQLAESGLSFLVFLFPYPESGRGHAAEYALIALRDDEGHFPGEHLVFLNLSGHALEGVLGERRLSVPRGQSAPVSVQDFVHGERVLLGLWRRVEAKPHALLENRLRFRRDRRTVIVLLPAPHSGSVDVVAFRVDEPVRAQSEAGKVPDSP